jgi:general secretion pathway protein G
LLIKETKTNRKLQFGFTLIELLVVIAIIGILSSVVIGSLNSSRAKSRDATRLSHMRALLTAIEVYRLDNNAAIADSGWIGSMGAGQNLNWLVYSGYIAELPSDPLYTGTNNDYYYRNNPGTYICIADNDISTFCVRFRMESGSAHGPAGFYCLSSRGIHRAGTRAGENSTATNGFTPNCTEL